MYGPRSQVSGLLITRLLLSTFLAAVLPGLCAQYPSDWRRYQWKSVLGQITRATRWRGHSLSGKQS